MKINSFRNNWKKSIFFWYYNAFFLLQNIQLFCSLNNLFLLNLYLLNEMYNMCLINYNLNLFLHSLPNTIKSLSIWKIYFEIDIQKLQIYITFIIYILYF